MSQVHSSREDVRRAPWSSLFVFTRGVATAVAVVLLVFHPTSDGGSTLALGVLVYGLGTVVLLGRSTRLAAMRLVWMADAVVSLGFVFAGGEWRSPAYLFVLTALILPVSSLRPPRALAAGGALTAAYLVVSLAVGLDVNALESSARLESFVTHLMVPMLVTVALAYAAALVGRLEHEQARSARLAVETERQRIAWELHDSAKQRIGVAHLMLTAARDIEGAPAVGELLDHALGELRHAGTDMDSSLAGLRGPLPDGRELPAALRERADDLRTATKARVMVSGEAGEISPFVAAHAYRIASEAMNNAVRHAHADVINVSIERSACRLTLVVSDDGRGMPPVARPGANGLRTMAARAEAIGGRLYVAPGEHGGTTVALEVPLTAVHEPIVA